MFFGKVWKIDLQISKKKTGKKVGFRNVHFFDPSSWDFGWLVLAPMTLISLF